MPRYFTLDEANAALDVIRPLVAEILAIRREILAKRPDFWPVLQNSLGNGGNLAAGEVALAFERLEDLMRQVHATGAQLKDLNTGLVDFYALREGRQIYLCWRYGEEQVAFWHEIDGGFAGRTPL